MEPHWVWVDGVLTKGYGVASGPSTDYPYGALERQFPIFRSRGLDLARFFPGTLNIDIRPLTFRLVRPEFTFTDVSWTDLHPPEHFSFSRCRVAHAGTQVDGWIYYPHPETKRRNFQKPFLLEVIATYIAGLATGDIFRVGVDAERVAIQAADI